MHANISLPGQRRKPQAARLFPLQTLTPELCLRGYFIHTLSLRVINDKKGDDNDVALADQKLNYEDLYGAFCLLYAL